MPKKEEMAPESAYVRQIRTEENMEAEAGGDYTLPDYLPEIRRVLRTDAALIPAGTYVGKDRASFSGVAAFSLIYTDDAGNPAAVPLDADYAYDSGERAALSCAVRDDCVTSLTCRPQGPRRVNIRTRIGGRVALYSESEPVTPEMLLPEGVSVKDTEVLVREAPSMIAKAGSTGELSVSDVAVAEGMLPDELRVLWCRGEVLIAESAVRDGGVFCRGEVRAMCMVQAGEGTLPAPFAISVPVEETVPVEEIADGGAWGYGVCRSVDVRMEDNGQGGTALVFDVGYELFACAYRNQPFRWVRDLYGWPMELRCDYREEKILCFAGCRQEVVAVTATAPREGESREAAGVLDATGRILTRECTVSRGRATVSGEWEAQLILSGAPDCKEGNVRFFPATLKLPYRAEIPLGDGVAGDGAEVRLSLCGVRARTEEGEFVVSADLGVSLCVTRTDTVTAVERVTVGEEAAPRENGVVTLYYPEEKESLWSVAKKYRVPLASLIERNDLPEDARESVDLPKKIDGLLCLVIG